MTEAGVPRLIAFDVEARRAAVLPGGPLAALADGLSRELEPMYERSLPIPRQKARLTRIGGRCPVHGAYLDFDPWSPHEHRCERCSKVYVAPEHDDWWAMGAQLWTVERAVHAAALYLLRGEERHAALASRILVELSDRYSEWPNIDNVLGPSRPFFSTYLESIWLLNICHALDLLECASAPDVQRVGQMVRQRILRPSSALIAGFHEGRSNRQVWNEVAVLSALTLLDDDISIGKRLDHADGLFGLMDQGLLEDGSWFEGENYHLFAHRGLWYGVEWLNARALEDDEMVTLSDDLGARYRAGFAVPFLGLLPDDTLPSRNDSQYAVSIRQWRIAEYIELGYAHTGDERLAGLLSHLYAGGEETSAASTARSCSTADVERNGAPSTLTRADLSWRALLAANLEAPPQKSWQPGSVFLPVQGLSVIRREGARVYVALEGGQIGGGHGHPHQLALTLQTDRARWLNDPGTGSYVERTLHWYRSTLAHAAPIFGGASQRPVAARTLAFEDRGGVGWISKQADGLAPGVRATRTLVVCDGYLVDLLEWNSDAIQNVVMPLCGEAELSGDSVHGSAAWAPYVAHGAGGLEDGFDFIDDVRAMTIASGQMVTLNARAWETGAHGDVAQLSYITSTEQEEGGATGAARLVRATVPGVPTQGSATRHWLEVRGTAGRIVGVWSWPRAEGRIVRHVDFSLESAQSAHLVAVTTIDGTVASHGRADHGWHIELNAGGAKSSIDLQGLVDHSSQASSDSDDNPSNELLAVDFEIPLVDSDLLGDTPGDFIEDALLLPLGAVHYLQTEATWAEAGEPTATLQLARTGTHLIADIAVDTGPIVAQVPNTAGAFDNPLDNERADVNADGLQWYIGAPDAGCWADAGLVAAAPIDPPGDRGRPRMHALLPGSPCDVEAHWLETDEGWAMRLTWRLDRLPVDADGCIAFDLLINERSPDRQRRRGQLVLSGGGGFAYLRGDRHEPAHALVIAVT